MSALPQPCVLLPTTVVFVSFSFCFFAQADERRIEEVHAKLIGPVEGGSEREDNGSGGDQGGGYGGQDQDEGAAANADRSPPASSVAGNPTR